MIVSAAVKRRIGRGLARTDNSQDIDFGKDEFRKIT
jgi:hypothetical protein